MHKRVLILGPTGVEKNAAVRRLQVHVAEQERFREVAEAIANLRYVNFESEYLEKAAAPWRSWVGFFNHPLPTQNMFWLKAWDAFSDSLEKESISILALHAVSASGVYGIRSACDIDKIASDFRPTLVITLIDDVFSMWRRTEERAAGRDIRGRPQIEQLLSARRAEQLIGDMIALKASSATCPVPHVLFSVGNSIDALANLVVNEARVTYLSFPISAPRDMLADGDPSFRDVLNTAHQLAQAEMLSNPERCFVSPLAIDELPFAACAERADEAATFEFGLADRWSVSDLWGANLSCVPPSDGVFCYPTKDVIRASALIRTDVGWRDRRLVQQANSLAIVCPKDPKADRITRGVEAELFAAGGLGIPCTVWQDPRWDPAGFVKTKLRSEAGTMGANPDTISVHIVDSLDEVIAAS